VPVKVQHAVIECEWCGGPFLPLQNCECHTFFDVCDATYSHAFVMQRQGVFCSDFYSWGSALHESTTVVPELAASSSMLECMNNFKPFSQKATQNIQAPKPKSRCQQIAVGSLSTLQQSQWDLTLLRRLLVGVEAIFWFLLRMLGCVLTCASADHRLGSSWVCRRYPGVLEGGLFRLGEACRRARPIRCSQGAAAVQTAAPKPTNWVRAGRWGSV
jgi:hypothetical protein